MKTVVEQRREIPVIRSCDVLIAGGGIAGIAAAIAAARNGADVLLLEREFSLGGLATLGLITIYLPLCDGLGNQLVYGIGEELLRLSIAHGAEANYPRAWLENGTKEEKIEKRFLTQFNPHLFALSAEKLLRSLGVSILYGTLACGVLSEGQTIKAVVIENKSGRSAIAVKSVIDCTGDADICALAGAKTRLYAGGNALASWYYHFSRGRVALKMFGLADVVPNEKGGSANLNEKVERIEENYRFSGVDGTQLSEAVLKAHQKMLEDILKNREEDETFVPVTISGIPLVRMSRRIEGCYTLGESEAHVHMEDSIGMTGDWRRRGPAYEIPFRTLFGNDFRNLLAAGRDISVTDGMWDITRVIPPCAVTGEAAGTAAAMTDDFPGLDVKKLQEKLEAQGVKLHLNQVLAEQ